MQPVAYRDQKWPEFWDAWIKSSGAEVRSSEESIDPERTSLIRGLQYGSLARLRECWATEADYYFADSGYFRAFDCEPRAWYRITHNAFTQSWVNEVPADRFERLRVPIRPWKKGGRDILVCPPYGGWVMDLFDAHGWLDETLASLNRYTDRPIRVRPKYSPSTIWDALEGAHALVTFMSNTGTDAAIFGVPAFVPPMNQAAPLGNVDLSQIETPVYNDREKWAHSLAYGQYSLEEMEDGTAWKIVQELA
jgi:hypothetical protein